MLEIDLIPGMISAPCCELKPLCLVDFSRVARLLGIDFNSAGRKCTLGLIESFCQN